MIFSLDGKGAIFHFNNCWWYATKMSALEINQWHYFYAILYKYLDKYTLQLPVQIELLLPGNTNSVASLKNELSKNEDSVVLFGLGIACFISINKQALRQHTSCWGDAVHSFSLTPFLDTTDYTFLKKIVLSFLHNMLSHDHDKHVKSNT